MQRAVVLADERKVRRVPVDCLRGLLDAQTDNKAEGCYALIVKGKWYVLSPYFAQTLPTNCTAAFEFFARVAFQ